MPVRRRLFCCLGSDPGAPTTVPSPCEAAAAAPGASAPGSIRFREGLAVAGACCHGADSGARIGATAMQSTPGGTPLQHHQNFYLIDMAFPHIFKSGMQAHAHRMAGQDAQICHA